MQLQTTQIRVTLPIKLQGYLRAKADKFGLSMAAYVKNLIIDDVKNIGYPVMKASTKTEDSYKKAMKERDQAIEVNNVDDYFDNL